MLLEGREIDFPVLRENPFSASPLERDQYSLHVGRGEILAKLADHIEYRSSQRVLMVGPLGSGRTSLLRCLSREAPLSVHVDHISSSNPELSLLQGLYSQLIDFNIPQHRGEIVNQMIRASNSLTGKLPLVVIDCPHIEPAVLEVALRDALPSLERLQVVMVVVLDHKQRAHLSNVVVQKFDRIENLSPLSIEEVQSMVEKRVNSVSNASFSLSREDAGHLLSICDGQPGSIIKKMRDAFDSQRIKSQGYQWSESNDDDIPSKLPEAFDTSALLPKDQPEADTSQIFSSVEDAALASVEIEEESDIIDASMPWEERDEPSQEFESEWIEETPKASFELNLGELDQAIENDEELPEHAYNATPQIFEPERERPPLPSGMFSGLASRNRDYVDVPEDEVAQNPVASSDGATLWIREGYGLPDDEPEEEITEAESAAIIHDEIGFEDEYVDFESEHLETGQQTLPFTTSIEPQPVLSTDSAVLNADISRLGELVSALQAALLVPQGATGMEHRAKLVDALTAFSTPKVGPRVDYPLNATVLSTLNHSEAIVVATAMDRKFSPSDEVLLEKLAIKRARLSQISNRLLKAGILNVRKIGKSRFFSLTQDARAQMIAWGMLGGDE